MARMDPKKTSQLEEKKQKNKGQKELSIHCGLGHIGFSSEEKFFRALDKNRNEIDPTIGPNDKLCLLIGTSHDIEKIKSKYLVDIDPCYTTLTDLFALFILHTKKVTRYGHTLYDNYIGL